MTSSSHRRSVILVWLIVLLGPGSALLRGQSDPRFAFAVAGGVVWAGGGEPDVTWVGGEGEPKTVWSADEGIAYVAQAGPRLAIGSWEALYTLTPGTWKAVKTETGRSITAMAASASTAVAFAGAGTVWLLEADGRWDFHPSGITGLVIEVAFARGRWVAVGSNVWVPPEGVDEDSEEGRPPATWYPSARIWTSTDGKTWIEAPLPDQDDGGTAALSTVAGGPQGFLAISEAGDACFSADGLTWTLRSAPMDFETFGNAPILRAVGGAFWLQEENYEETGKLYRTVDAQTWELQPKAEGAERAALFIKDGIVQAVGRRKEGRGLGFAAVTEYAKVPEPNAAEIAAAAAKAAEEKRLVEEKAAAERRAAEERTRAAEQAEREKRLAEQQTKDEAVRPLVAALQTFDSAMLAARTYDAMGQPLGELVKALEGKVDPALANAIYLAARDVMASRGGALGVHSLSMNIPDSRLGPLMTYLREQGTPAHREIIRGLSTQTLDRIYNRPLTPVDTSSWPPSKREAATQARTDIWDLSRIRSALLSGAAGAVVDLEMAYSEGQSVLADPALALFWSRVGFHLMPELNAVRDNDDRFYEVAMAKGSAFGRLWRAQRLSDARGGEVASEVRALLDAAAAGGFKQRDQFLAEYESTWSNETGGKAAEPRRFEYTWKMPPALAPAEAALARFEREFVAAGSLSEVGAPAARLIATLEGVLPREAFDPWLMGVTKFVSLFAGVEGYMAYRRALPPPLVPLASAFVLAHHEQYVNRVLAQPGAAIPTDVLREWPAQARRKEPRREEQNLFLDHVRARLLEGQAGAAVDLGLEYFNGRGVVTDRNLLYFFVEIASAIKAGNFALPNDRNQLVDFLIDEGAAQGSYMAALEMMPEETILIKDPEVRRFLEAAAQSGHALASMRLSMSYVAEVEALSGVSDKEMGLDSESVERSLADMRAMGVSEAAIEAYVAQGGRAGEEAAAGGLTADEQLRRNQAEAFGGDPADATQSSVSDDEVNGVGMAVPDAETLRRETGFSDAELASVRAAIDEGAAAGAAIVEAGGDRQAIIDKYVDWQRKRADAHRQLADLAMAAATGSLRADQGAANQAKAEELKKMLRDTRLNEAIMGHLWANSHEGKLRESLVSQVRLQAVALERFKMLPDLVVPHAAGIRDPAKAGIAPYAQIHWGRKLLEHAGTLASANRVDRIKAWIAANPRPTVWDPAFDQHVDTATLAYFAFHGDSFNGLDLAERWLPWFGSHARLHLMRGQLLARQGRREGAILAFDLYHALRDDNPPVAKDAEFEELVRKTDPILWAVPEEPFESMLITINKVSDDASNRAPLTVIRSEAAQRTLGRRLELAARLPADRRAAAIQQVLKQINPLQDGYVPFGVADRFNPLVERFNQARLEDDYRSIREALPLEAAGTVAYWRIRATAASYIEPQLTDGLVDVVAGLQPDLDWLKLGASVVRERAQATLRRINDGPAVPAAIAAALKEAERAQLKSDAAAMKAAVDRALAQDAASIPAKLMRIRLTLAQGGTVEGTTELRTIAQDTTLHAKYRAEAWGLLAVAEVEAAQKAAAANPASAAGAMTRMATVVTELAGSATALRPNQPEAHLALIMVVMAGGQTSMQDPAKRAEMRTHLDAALTDRKDHPQALMMRGQLNGMENRVPEATTDFELLAKEYPEIIPVRVQLMQLYAQQRRWGDAERQIADLQKLGFPQAAQLRQQLQSMQQAGGGGGGKR